MPKKIAIVFFVSVLVFLIAPQIVLAGSYTIDRYDWQNFGGQDKIFDDGDKLGNKINDKSIEVEYSGLVPCGKCVEATTNNLAVELPDNVKTASIERCGQKESNTNFNQIYVGCSLCHFFVMLDGMISFMLIKIIPPLAVLMLVIGGVMFYLGGAKPDLLTRAKSLLRGVFIGLFLIYGAYMIVGILLDILGATKMNAVGSVFKEGVFSVECPIKMPTEKATNNP